VDRDTFSALAVIAVVAVIAPLVSEWVKGRVPGVVLEIGLGILIGPQVLALAKVTPVVDGLAGIGLTFLFFMAGYEIDLQRIRGRPLALAVSGWAATLVLGLAFAATLVCRSSSRSRRSVSIGAT
jgi:Kef-type K+ transport system membrane component KefB